MRSEVSKGKLFRAFSRFGVDLFTRVGPPLQQELLVFSRFTFNSWILDFEQSELAGRGGGVPFFAMSGQLCELMSE